MADDERLLSVKRAGAAIGDEASVVEWGTERLVDAPTMRAAMGEIDVTALVASPGGSAFNAVHTLASADTGLRLGHLGISGALPVPGVTAHEHLDRLSIDRSWVEVDLDRLGGVCLSIMGSGERTLLVHPGVNTLMAEHLEQNAPSIVEYLTSARAVHVTSFLDDATPAVLAAVLGEVKRRSPETAIVVDPGHVWCTEPTTAIESVIALGDVVLLNDREFGALGQAEHVEAGGPGHLGAAEGLLARLRPGSTVVHKLPAGAWVFRDAGGSVEVTSYTHRVLAEDEIEDSTGAGDVFAGGLLAAVAGGVEFGAAIRLGMALAKTKLRYAGVAGHARFAEIARSALPG